MTKEQMILKKTKEDALRQSQQFIKALKGLYDGIDEYWANASAKLEELNGKITDEEYDDLADVLTDFQLAKDSIEEAGNFMKELPVPIDNSKALGISIDFSNN